MSVKTPAVLTEGSHISSPEARVSTGQSPLLPAISDKDGDGRQEEAAT
jgi:hypothetical protein